MITDIATICSLFILVIGWIVNSYLNRRNDIAKERFKYRKHALDKFIEIYFYIEGNSNPFSDPEFLTLIRYTRVLFAIYGNEDEYNLFEKFIKACEQNDLEEANNILYSLRLLVRKSIRKELGFNHF